MTDNQPWETACLPSPCRVHRAPVKSVQEEYVVELRCTKLLDLFCKKNRKQRQKSSLKVIGYVSDILSYSGNSLGIKLDINEGLHRT